MRMAVRERILSTRTWALVCLAFIWPPSVVRAEMPYERVLRGVGIEQKLDTQLPTHLFFRDEQGRQVRLGEYFGRRPVVLALVYYDCPMLCNLILNGLISSLKAVSLNVGEDFDVLAISFDPGEGPELAAAKKSAYVKQYGRAKSSQGWHFLTGEEDSIRELTETVGFRYFFDEETNQFAHASGIMVLTPQGKLARYLYGVEYPPRDLRLALVEAADHRIGSPVDQLLLLCFHYDPTTGKYGFVVMTAIRILGLATIITLGTFMIVMFRRDRRRPA